MNIVKALLIVWGLCCPCLSFAAEGDFVRGDANGEGAIDVSDAVTVLRHLFAGLSLPCHDAADVNDDGDLDVTDGIAALGFLFALDRPPPAPFPDCGADATEDELTCETYAPCPARDPIVSIAVFNVENFSQSEFAKEQVTRVVVRVIREFDMVVIQEIKDPAQIVPDLLLARVNAEPGETYDMVEGPPIGRNEQYAIYYKRELFEFRGAYVQPDPDNILARDVLVASFRSGDFDFTLLTIHANHIGTATELAELADVFDAVLASSVSEQDVVLFGDLNADCQAFNVNTPGHPLRIPRFHWVIPDSADTNVRANQDCSRDRIILLDATHDSEYVPGSAAVFHFDQAYGLSEAAAVDVSDHYPVFARFDTSAPDDD